MIRRYDIVISTYAQNEAYRNPEPTPAVRRIEALMDRLMVRTDWRSGGLMSRAAKVAASARQRASVQAALAAGAVRG